MNLNPNTAPIMLSLFLGPPKPRRPLTVVRLSDTSLVTNSAWARDLAERGARSLTSELMELPEDAFEGLAHHGV